jgi:hypothetical protein
MNIFVLDNDPVVAAQMQCNKHVVKMPLECAQMLSTVHHIYDSDRVPFVYQPTHRNHPCTLWASQSRANYAWLFDHFRALSDEYFHRYFKRHKSWRLLSDVVDTPPAGMRNDDITPFAQAMPDEYKCDDAVTAYRAYYKNDKADLLVYTRRSKPVWLTC